MSYPSITWAAAAAWARDARGRARPALAQAGWWTLAAILAWIASHLLLSAILDRVAPLPDAAAAAGPDVDVGGVLIAAALRIAAAGVQLAVFCLVPLPALYGMAWIALCASRGQRVRVGLMCAPLRQGIRYAAVVGLMAAAALLPFLLWAALIMAAAVVLSVQGAMSGADQAEIALRIWWLSVILMVPFVVVSVWIQCRWVYAPLALADGAAPWAALKESWRITGTRPASAWACIALSMIGWCALTAAALLLPLAWIGLPRIAAAFAAGYALVRGDAAPVAAQRPHEGSAHGSQ